ncbi:GRB10-interacting GYF protein 2 [Phytophthora ramorum]|uniref:GRB10-interacting GYF protein 2 n=1 Tax=Phytophthora ramorum TaxID=164328 RepID=UPI0030A890FF|nr:GRB10-interacting GYF protein 2 [Phytophthora ramorum]
MSSSSPSHDDDFVTKTTKHRKKQQQDAAKKPPTGTSADGASNSSSNISLRPRTMFAMKGRGRTESEGSAYRPQWSKDGEGFVSSSASGGPASFKDAAAGAADEHRRKNKVLRYSKEELLALHFTTSEAPAFPPDTSVASEHSLPPVSTLPFDYEEIYKQWSLNRNRGRGRGRGNASAGGAQNARGHQERGARGEENEAPKQQRDDHRHNERDSTWERGARVTESSRAGDDVWDDVLEPGTDNNEMDLSSMAEAAEKFRREMNAMREELQGPKVDPDEIKDDLDAFDQKLEDAAAAGQFDDSDNEDVQWEDSAPEEQHSANGANGPVEDHTADLLGRQSSGGHLFDALEPAREQLALEEKSSFSLSPLQPQEGFPGLSSLRLEVEDEWFYLDPQGLQQGPFKTADMREWFEAGYFKPHLPIRFGREGTFGALANQFVHGEVPFASPPTRVGGVGGNQSNNNSANDSFRSDGMQIQFQSDYRTQHQLNMQNPQPLGQDAMFLNNEVQRRDQAFWPNAAPELSSLDNATSALGARPASPMALEPTQPPAPKSPAAVPVVDAWGGRPTSPEHPTPTLHDIQNDEKRRAVNEVRESLGGNGEQAGTQQEQRKAASPVKTSAKDDETDREGEKMATTSPPKKNGKKGENAKSETNAWATKMASTTASNASKSLKDIQQEEQREMLSKMDDEQSGSSNLAQMGAQLKMMLGVDSMAVAPSSPSAPAPAAKSPSAPTPAPAAPAASPWGAPAVVPKRSNSKSMRDILAEEERLAQERAKANENVPTSSHWMNIVAGNKVAAAAIPKPSRSVLGPVPASVLKSRQQVRAVNGAARPSPPKAESDASFWNFGVAQPADKESAGASGSVQVGTSNAFGSNNVSSEFMMWAMKQLTTIDSNANVTLLEYCASVEDPGEIREYLAAYLGSTPRVSAFATEFIQRKKTQHSGKKSPGHQDAQQRASETGSSNKRGKRRTKGQKIDPSLLNYSVGS